MNKYQLQHELMRMSKKDLLTLCKYFGIKSTQNGGYCKKEDLSWMLVGGLNLLNKVLPIEGEVFDFMHNDGSGPKNISGKVTSINNDGEEPIYTIEIKDSDPITNITLTKGKLMYRLTDRISTHRQAAPRQIIPSPRGGFDLAKINMPNNKLNAAWATAWLQKHGHGEDGLTATEHSVAHNELAYNRNYLAQMGHNNQEFAEYIKRQAAMRGRRGRD